MSEQFFGEVSASDPLSDVTRNERKFVLGLSAFGIVIVKAGLVPSKISALGIEFAQTDQRALVVALAVVISYFLIAFVLYAVSDVITLRYKKRRAWMYDVEYLDKNAAGPVYEIVGEDKIEASEESKKKFLKITNVRFERERLRASRVSILRFIFEFILPIILAIYTIVILIRHTP